jgi:DNA-binding response OmpR family regulator
MRILLIDDDEQLMEVLANKLIQEQYAVDIADTGEMGREFLSLFNYDLLVLDWILPDIDGVQLCQQIRLEGHKMPIMLLTARDRQNDIVVGLDAGADDYVVKPFDFEELTARIRALLRRDIQVLSPILQWQQLSLDPKTHEVKLENQLLPLTPKEYAFIELFMRHPQQVFSPSAIIDNLWAGEDPPGEEAVRTHIKGLRHKLQAVGMPKNTIQTVYGIGYRLNSLPKTTEKTQDKAQSKDSALEISAAWLQFKDVAWQRLAILKEFTVALRENKITPILYQEARSSAHKLAGSLGGFGFPQGSKIAKQIENFLDKDLAQISQEMQEFLQLVASLHRELKHQPFEDRVREALDKNISLLIIDRDLNNNSSYIQQLISEADQKEIKTKITSSLKQAREIIEGEFPSAILQKIVFPNGEELAFLGELHQQAPQLPVVILTEKAQLSDRLEIVRKGGNLILQSPIAASTVIDAIIDLIYDKGDAAKVLIVDDDPQILLSLEISLQPWNFQLTTLDNPQNFWQVLEAVEPDLLVLDVEMPEINGIELCQLLRSDRRWQQLPVLFLTVHQDEKTQYQAFAIGADDYIVKPVIGSELANRIINRLQRIRAINH